MFNLIYRETLQTHKNSYKTEKEALDMAIIFNRIERKRFIVQNEDWLEVNLMWVYVLRSKKCNEYYTSVERLVPVFSNIKDAIKWEYYEEVFFMKWSIELLAWDLYELEIIKVW